MLFSHSSNHCIIKVVELGKFTHHNPRKSVTDDQKKNSFTLHKVFLDFCVNSTTGDYRYITRCVSLRIQNKPIRNNPTINHKDNV